jgi:hypothetical protein
VLRLTMRLNTPHPAELPAAAPRTLLSLAQFAVRMYPAGTQRYL